MMTPEEKKEADKKAAEDPDKNGYAEEEGSYTEASDGSAGG